MSRLLTVKYFCSVHLGMRNSCKVIIYINAASAIKGKTFDFVGFCRKIYSKISFITHSLTLLTQVNIYINVCIYIYVCVFVCIYIYCLGGLIRNFDYTLHIHF